MADGNYARLLPGGLGLASLTADKAKLCLDCGAPFAARKNKRYCDTCSSTRRAIKSGGGSCPHDKPKFLNGKERKFCFECVPKGTSTRKPPKRYELKKRDVVLCGAPGCGKEFRKLVAHQKHCSRACSNRERNRLTAERIKGERSCVSCGDRFLAYKVSTVQWCSQRCKLEALRGLFHCQHCGVEYLRKKRRGDEGKTYCSRECAFAAKTQRSLEAQGPKFSAYFAKRCEACGEAGGGRRDWRWCSGCKREQTLAAARATENAMNEAKHKAAGKVIVCRGCDAQFCPLYGTKERHSCQVCKPGLRRELERATKERRDKRIKSGLRETVVKRKVFERDGWLCRLCGIATPKELRGTYEHNVPELDHVVPLARGGAHTYANTQCLCRSCNGFKGARTMDEVMAALADVA